MTKEGWHARIERGLKNMEQKISTTVERLEEKVDGPRNRRNRRDLALEQVDGEELLFADGYDDAILGVVYRDHVNVVIYDRTKVLQILEKDMSPEDAVEFFEFNVSGAYVGPQTPIFLEMLSEETAGQGFTATETEQEDPAEE